jgi:hypothetical protein
MCVGHANDLYLFVPIDREGKPATAQSYAPNSNGGFQDEDGTEESKEVEVIFTPHGIPFLRHSHWTARHVPQHYLLFVVVFSP